MGSGGTEWEVADVVSASRMNQKTLFVGTGAQINALSTTYAGQKAFCTSTSDGFLAGHTYKRNPGNTSWAPAEILYDSSYTDSLTDATNYPFLFNTSTNILASLRPYLPLAGHTGLWYNQASGAFVSFNYNPIITDPFTGYTTQGEADAAWVSQDTAKSRVDISNDYLAADLVDDSTNNSISLDLGAPVSDSAFVLRFKLSLIARTDPSAFTQVCHIGISSTDSSGASNSTQDFLGLEWSTSSAGAASDLLYTNDADGANLNGSADTVFTHVPIVETLYVEIKRTSTTSYTISLYSDSGFSSLVEAQTSACPATITGLQFICLKNQTNTGRAGTMSLRVDDVTLKDGVTSW